MVVTSYHQAMTTVGLQHHHHHHRHHHHHHHHHHIWSSPCHTPSHAVLFSRHRRPAISQPRRQRVSVIRADSQDGRRPASSGDNDSKEVLEAFFLGKAFAEAVTERLGTVVGELLSDVGRWQAEQQKQVRDFQEEVQERAKKARARALQEARSAERKEVPSVSQNGASAAGGDDKEQTVVPLRRPDAQDSTSL